MRGPIDASVLLAKYHKHCSYLPQWRTMAYHNTYTTHLAFYTAIWLIFFDLEFWNLTSIEFHGDSEFAIHFGI